MKYIFPIDVPAIRMSDSFKNFRQVQIYLFFNYFYLTHLNFWRVQKVIMLSSVEANNL